MGKRLQVKLPFWGGVLTLLGVIVLCTLGNWQLQRLAWKNSIIERLDTAYAKDAVRLTYEDLTPQSDSFYLRRGMVTGTLDHSKEIAIEPRIFKGKPGYHIITPLYLNGGGALLVNRGWTAEKTTRKELSIGIDVVGVARRPDWTSFTSSNSPAHDRWFKLDIAEIAAAKNLEKVAPIILYAESAKPAFADTIPAATRWEPNNNHLQYAIFWFLMASILIVIFSLYVVKTRK